MPDRVTLHTADAVAQAVARGFQDNEIWAWILPDERRRAWLLPRYYRMMIRNVFIPNEGAWTTAQAAGGALWLPPGAKFGAEVAMRELLVLLPAIGIRGLKRALAIDRLKKRHRPAEAHWYLETLSIEPARQRQGHGTALMAPGLERCDEQGLPAYLETQRRSNIPYYERFGFELLDEVSTGESPPLWLMWRPPEGDL